MLAIIDADFIIWRAGKVEEAMQDNEFGLSCALHNTKNIMESILEELKPDHTKVFIGSLDKSNYRYEIYPEYKANRKEVEKPTHMEKIREYLITHYNAIWVTGKEADDACATFFTQNKELNPVLVAVDKDFQTIAGDHYNPVKKEMQTVTEVEALRFFYTQLLTGDRADNIPRIKFRWLSKRYENQLLSCNTNEEMFKLAFQASKEALYGKEPLTEENCQHIMKELVLRGKLLHLQRYENDMWEPPLTITEDIYNELLPF